MDTSKLSPWGLIPEKLQSRIERTDSCWLWIGDKTDRGYGRIFWAGKMRRAHRLVYAYIVGQVLDSELVCHNCPGGDNPACVNPDHLFVGTHQENRKDCVAKGRQAKGDSHVIAKLTEEDACRAVALHEQGRSRNSLARQFNVSPRTMGRVLSGENWGHATALVAADEWFKANVERSEP